MKKTFTILAVVMLFTTAASAQFGGNRSGDNGYDNTVGMNTPDRRDYGNHGRNYYFSEREKDMQIARINHQYHERIEDVRFNLFMPRFKKQRVIEALQFQRDRDIHEVMEKFYGRGRYHRDHDDYSRRNW